MNERQTITVSDEPQQIGEEEIISFELTVEGKTIPFAINVTAENATLADIVPAARKLSSKIAIAVRERITENNQSVPCQKGCSACCSSLIPLSVPEVFRLSEEFLAMPSERSNHLLRNCIATAEKILSKAKRTACMESFSKNAKTGTSQINKWYGDLKLACPFLCENLCVLYEERPLACREHIVTGSSDSCQNGRKCRPNVAAMPVSVLEAMGQLASELEGTDVEAIMLPFSLAWVQDNIDRAERRWPAKDMVLRFVEILKEKALRKRNRPADSQA